MCGDLTITSDATIGGDPIVRFLVPFWGFSILKAMVDDGFLLDFERI